MPEYGPVDVCVGMVSRCHVGSDVVSACEFLLSCVVPRCIYMYCMSNSPSSKDSLLLLRAFLPRVYAFILNIWGIYNNMMYINVKDASNFESA